MSVARSTQRAISALFIAVLSSFVAAADSVEIAREAIRQGQGAQAFKSLHPVAKAGDTNACYWLGRLYYYDIPGITQNYRRAAHWFELAARGGHASAQYKLGGMYFSGRGVNTNMARATWWWYLAARQWHPEALNNLGALLSIGNGAPYDPELGLALQLRAARDGSEAAERNVERKRGELDSTAFSRAQALSMEGAELEYRLEKLSIGSGQSRDR